MRIFALALTFMMVFVQNAHAGPAVIWGSPYPIVLGFGGIRIQNSDTTTTCNAAAAGSIRYNAGSFEGCNGTVWAAMSGSSGTVTSVALSVPAFLSIAGSPVTTSGTLAVSLSGTALPVANGGTNSTSALNSNRVMISSGGAIVENAALTQGQLVFPDSNGLPSGSSNLAWNNTDPSLTMLSSITDANAVRGYLHRNSAAATFGGLFQGQQSRGTIGSPTATQSGDTLAQFSGRGYGTSALTSTVGAMFAIATETFSGTAAGTKLQFATTPNTTTTRKTALEIDQDQGLKIFNADGSSIKHLVPVTTTYSLTWPNAQASGSKVLQNDGSGNLSWGSGVGAALSALTAATGTNTIANANNTQTWNWDTLSTESALALASTSMTSGNLLAMTASRNNADVTGNMISLTASGASNAAVGLNISHSGTDNAAKGVKINMSGASGEYRALDITNASAGTDPRGVTISMTAAAGTGTGLAVASASTAGGAKGVLIAMNGATGASSVLAGSNATTSSSATNLDLSLTSASAAGTNAKLTHGGTGGLNLQVTSQGTGTRNQVRIDNSVAAANNSGSSIQYAANNDNATLVAIAGVAGIITDVTNTAYKGALVFQTSNNAAPAERARFDNTGLFGLGVTAPLAQLHVVATATATGIPKAMVLTAAANTNMTLSTEVPDVTLNLARTVQWATGALATQRAVLIQAPTYSFVGSSTITNAATLGITGAPVKSTNAALTNTHGILVSAGAVSTATNSFGLSVNAQTGATNNYAAQFIGGNVGVGTASPGHKLVIRADDIGLPFHDDKSQFQIQGSTSLAKQLSLGVNTTETPMYSYIQSSENGVAPREILLNPDGGNVGIGIEGVGVANAAQKLHQDAGTATANYHQWTAKATTGQTAGDGFLIGLDASANAILNQQENLDMIFSTNGAEAFRIEQSGAMTYPRTNTAGGTTGNQTINKISGTVNVAAAGTTVTVTNSLVATTSICFVVARTNDSTCSVKNVVPGAGSFVINLTAACTAETSFGFKCIN